MEFTDNKKRKILRILKDSSLRVHYRAKTGQLFFQDGLNIA